MYIIGFDPGLASTGWAVLDKDKEKVIDSGIIKTDAAQDKLGRLYSLRQSIRAILQAYSLITPKPEVAIEDFIFQKRTTQFGDEVPLKSAELLNRAVQVIVSECWGLGFKPTLYSATEIKEAIAGYGRANKEAVKRGVKLRLGDAPKSNHSIDAAAAVIYHADLMVVNKAIASSEIKQLMRK